MSTGDELADLDERFSEEKDHQFEQLRDCGGGAEEAGGIPFLLGIARDTPAALKEKDLPWVDGGYCWCCPAACR